PVSKFGQAVVFTASVAAMAPGAGLPTGTIVFMDGMTVLGTTTLNNGSATLTRSDLAVGSHLITAEYAGDGWFSGSAGFVGQEVKAAATSWLSGYVYVDRSNDGIKQANEPGISGVSLKLVNAAGVIVGSALTDCSGAYTFTGVTSGVYTILETQPGHYVDGIETA